MPPMSSKARRRRKVAGIVLGIALLIPPLQVALVKFIDPPTTGPIVVRWIGGKFARETQPAAELYWMPLSSVPTNFLTCVLAGEDKKFFSHAGFDWTQLKYSLKESAARGAALRGASTITQQCARSLFLWQKRSWLRKGLETYYTIWMELLLSKQRILELYVNVIELGNGVYGLEAGSQHHFGIHASDLTRDQVAMLVIIMPSPKRWNPVHPQEWMLDRQTNILAQAERIELPITLTK